MAHLSSFKVHLLPNTMSMPGAFPQVGPSRQRSSSGRSPLSAEQTLIEPDFISQKDLCAKVSSQKSLIASLSSTTYFLIGYQFVRYTHTACLPPSLLHLFIQTMLQPWRATTLSELDLFADHLDVQEQYFALQLLPFDRQAAARMLLKRTCLLIYWKFFSVVAYHILFFTLWVRPVALNGQLKNLEHGSWYGLSFIGETISIDILKTRSFFVQLWKLELGQVLLLDLVILLLQLTLYQCIFVQSTLSPRGLRLNEPEAFILRGTPGVPNEKLTEPDLIQVRLYETLSKDAFSIGDEY